MAAPIVFNQAEVDRVLNSPDGPVFKDIQRRTIKVHGAARRQVGVNTGRLRSSIRWRMGRDAVGLFGLIGSDVEYAALHHEGTRAHVIRPNTAKALWWKGARHPVKQVNHPGTRANRFLTDALLKAAT